MQRNFKKIAFFNHKGGVSKTTSVFHIGWMMAELGKRVMMVDCDPQCNLTGLTLSFTDLENYPYESITEIGPSNIKDAVRPTFENDPSPIKTTRLQKIEQREGLYVLPGHVGLSQFESTLAIAHDISNSLAAVKNVPGALHHAIDLAADNENVDFVLLDLSPSLGALNQNLLMGSDGFVVPMAPDFFSSMALNSLGPVDIQDSQAG